VRPAQPRAVAPQGRLQRKQAAQPIHEGLPPPGTGQAHDGATERARRRHSGREEPDPVQQPACQAVAAASPAHRRQTSHHTCLSTWVLQHAVLLLLLLLLLLVLVLVLVLLVLLLLLLLRHAVLLQAHKAPGPAGHAPPPPVHALPINSRQTKASLPPAHRARCSPRCGAALGSSWDEQQPRSSRHRCQLDQQKNPEMRLPCRTRRLQPEGGISGIAAR
jgi:hypothetical protein